MRYFLNKLYHQIVVSSENFTSDGDTVIENDMYQKNCERVISNV